ncbi:MAG TPA: site-2 protease family protein [Gemmatimonadales bacterium]|nr:site-2 protease family protein [Gemmatimonadales bacterium]
MPLFPTFIGTMGAFIRLRSVLNDRRQLFDVGVWGPIAGFAVALPVLIIGISQAQVAPGHGAATGLLLPLGSETWVLGDSLVTLLARRLFYGGTETLIMGPVGFAGWVGMFVTMLNLLPMGQLDGGHILYARLPQWHRRVALAFWLIVFALGRLWFGWYVWGGLVLALSRGRLGHPPVLDSLRPLPPTRGLAWWLAVALFVVTFSPIPVIQTG